MSHSKATATASGLGCLAPLLILGLTLLIAWAWQPSPTKYTSLTSTEAPPGSTSVVTDEWQAAFLERYEARMGPVPAHHRSMLWSNAIVMCNYLSVKTKHTYKRTFDYGTDKLGMTAEQTAAVIEEAGRTYCPEDYEPPAG